MIYFADAGAGIFARPPFSAIARNCFHEIINSALRFSHFACADSSDSGCIVRAAKLRSTSRQLRLDGLFLAVQIPPMRVDHRSLGVRNLLRPIFTKQIDRKVFHHVVEEVFLTPSTEQSNTIFHPRSTVSRADQARLMSGDRQLPNLSHPQPVFPITDPRPASARSIDTRSPVGIVTSTFANSSVGHFSPGYLW